MKMIDIDRKWGGVRLRAWGLLANFIANTGFLIGLSRIVRGEDGTFLVAVGAISTLIILAIIAVPDVRKENR